LLDASPDERRRGPLERFEKLALSGFAVAVLVQAILGSLLAATGILLCGALWLLRERRMFGGVLAVPVGLFLSTIGLYSAYTATNVPFVGILGRFALPLLLILAGALLLFAEQDWQFQRVPFAFAAIAFVVAQTTLTIESRSGARAIPTKTRASGGVMGEVELIPIARAFLEARKAIVVRRWIVEDNTVVGFGTTSGKPAAVRVEFRNGRVIEWQVYTVDGGSQ
jgi:hypothetical protein